MRLFRIGVTPTPSSPVVMCSWCEGMFSPRDLSLSPKYEGFICRKCLAHYQDAHAWDEMGE